MAAPECPGAAITFDLFGTSILWGFTINIDTKRVAMS